MGARDLGDRRVLGEQHGHATVTRHPAAAGRPAARRRSGSTSRSRRWRRTRRRRRPRPGPGSRPRPDTTVSSSPPLDSSRSTTSRADARQVVADDDDVAVDDAEDVTRPARTAGRQRLLGGDGDRAVAGGGRRAAHREDVVAERLVRVVDRERRDALDRGAGGHDAQVDALLGGHLGRGVRGEQGVAVVGQQDHAAGSGRADRLEELGRVGPPPGPARDHHAPRPTGTPRPGPRRPRSVTTACASRVRLAGHLVAEVGHLDPVRPTRGDAGLDGGTDVVDVHVDVVQVAGPDDEERVAEPVQALLEDLDGVVGRSRRAGTSPRMPVRRARGRRPAARGSPAGSSRRAGAAGRRRRTTRRPRRRSPPARGTRAAGRSRRRRRRPHRPAPAGAAGSGSRPAPRGRPRARPRRPRTGPRRAPRPPASPRRRPPARR